MAMEDYIPTALIVFLAKPFFDAFLKKAGEDSYVTFKKGLASLVKKAAAIKVTIFASAEKKVDPKYPYSHVVSIYSKSADGFTLKFLFSREATMNTILRRSTLCASCCAPENLRNKPVNRSVESVSSTTIVVRRSGSKNSDLKGPTPAA